MRRLYLRAAAIMGLVLLASGSVFEVLLDEVWRVHEAGPLDPALQASLERALWLSTLVDLLLVGVAAVALIWPVYARLRRVQSAALRIQAGERGVRVGLDGRDLLAALGGAFDAMASATEQQLDNQRALMRAVSHELRTPVARLRFALEALAEAEPDLRAERRRDADRDIAELDALIDEILVYARVSPGGVQPERQRFDLAEELASLVAALEAFGPIVLEAPPSLLVDGDPRLLRRAVQNLLINAQRHARQRVYLHLSAQPEVRVIVEDDGPGVSESVAERMFEPFVREGTDKDGHHGLGLAIARAIAVRHGGALTLNRARGPRGGARFCLALPSPAASVPSP